MNEVNPVERPVMRLERVRSNAPLIGAQHPNRADC